MIRGRYIDNTEWDTERDRYAKTETESNKKREGDRESMSGGPMFCINYTVISHIM